jgi:hypothetical protein
MASDSPVRPADDDDVNQMEEPDEAVMDAVMDVEDPTEPPAAADVSPLSAVVSNSLPAEELPVESAEMQTGVEEVGASMTEGLRAPTERAYVEFTHKHQPVYFLSYLHALTQGWPKLGTLTDASSETALMTCAGHILTWAETVMRTEVWSIRRAALQLVGVLAAAGHLPAEHAPRILGVIEAGIQEQKYAKVRVEALRSLALVLQSPLRACVDGDAELKSRVREVVRSASTDSQPTILEAVAKVQNIWLK